MSENNQENKIVSAGTGDSGAVVKKRMMAALKGAGIALMSLAAGFLLWLMLSL